MLLQALAEKYGAPPPSRWNGRRNVDGTTTGQRQTTAECTKHWWRLFQKEFPSIRKYKTSSMSIMRANKATPAVRDEHFKGFMKFLDRLQSEGYLSDEQRAELFKYLCCYDEVGFDPDGKSSKRTVSLKRKRKKRRQKRGKKEQELWRQQVELVNREGDNSLFHVTCGLFCWADQGQGHETKPFMVHAGSGLRLDHVYGMPGYPVATSTNGSVDLENFPKMACHFIDNLPQGFGKNGKPTILIMDGHSSRWSPVALKMFKDNNVHVWVIASHSSAWGQVGDVGPNSKLKKWYNHFARIWRRAHRGYKLRKHHFNKIFVQAHTK